MRLLLEAEAAEILRCSREKVKRLRLSGQLAYIPGRPVTIDEADLNAYVEKLKAREDEKAAARGRSTNKSLSADEWVRLALLKPKRAPRRPR